jgi:hypothetical protein
MSPTLSLERSTAISRVLIDLATGKLDESEIEALEAVLLADAPAAPEHLIDWAIQAPRCSRIAS